MQCTNFSRMYNRLMQWEVGELKKALLMCGGEYDWLRRDGYPAVVKNRSEEHLSVEKAYVDANGDVMIEYRYAKGQLSYHRCMNNVSKVLGYGFVSDLIRLMNIDGDVSGEYVVSEIYRKQKRS